AGRRTAFRRPASRTKLGDGRLVNALDRLVERAVELVVRLLGLETFGQRAREACGHAGVARELLVRFGAAVAAGKRDDATDLRVSDQVRVEVVLARVRELQPDALVARERVELLIFRGLQVLLGAFLVRRLDVDLGLDDRHETPREDLLADVELLLDDGRDAGR